MSTPLLLRKPNGGAAVAQSSSDAAKAPRARAPAQGEKIVVRRLPPAMTEDEFTTILGEEWRIGQGKIDWFSYWPGKVSQQSVAALPSLRPSLSAMKARANPRTLLLQPIETVAAFARISPCHPEG